MAKLTDIEGIGEKFAAKLTEAGITTTEALLGKGGAAKGRKELAEKTGISGDLLLQWVNHADLFRVKGIGAEYADLLEAAGVDSVPELAQRKADNLFQKLGEVNQAKKLVRKLPVQSQVANWVEQAKQLPKLVTH
jgi:predicted flap endonuclease-1-like 5' DNA nuclease